MFGSDDNVRDNPRDIVPILTQRGLLFPLGSYLVYSCSDEMWITIVQQTPHTQKEIPDIIFARLPVAGWVLEVRRYV